MASVFPALFTFSEIGVTLLRITAALYFLMFGVRLMLVAQTVPEKTPSVRLAGYLYGATKTLVGILFLFGLYTQIAAILGMFLSGITLIQGASGSMGKSTQQVQLLLFVLSASLLFLGPGLFAIDFPL